MSSYLTVLASRDADVSVVSQLRFGKEACVLPHHVTLEYFVDCYRDNRIIRDCNETCKYDCEGCRITRDAEMLPLDGEMIPRTGW